MSYTTRLKYTLTRDDDSEIELELTVTGTWSTPGYISGPPEDCYPPEPGEITDVDATCEGVPFDLEALSQAEYLKVDTYINENAEESATDAAYDDR
jgi:hypothetical protein